MKSVAGVYRRARRALLGLGLAANAKKFPALEPKDVVPFVVSTDDEQLGDGKKVPSWVWSNFRMLEGQGPERVKEYCGESESTASSYYLITYRCV